VPGQYPEITRYLFLSFSPSAHPVHRSSPDVGRVKFGWASKKKLLLQITVFRVGSPPQEETRSGTESEATYHPFSRAPLSSEPVPETCPFRCPRCTTAQLQTTRHHPLIQPTSTCIRPL